VGQHELPEQPACENCHSNGGEGFIATQQTSLFYNVVSTKKYFFCSTSRST